MSDMTPDPDVQRQILTAKLNQHKAKGYEWAVNAQVAEAAGDPDATVRECEKKSRANYAAARRLERMLDELPEPEDDDGGGDE